MKGLEGIVKIPVTDQVVSNLKELITSGQFQVGDKLPTEKEICSRLKVGRSTVREAFRVLKALGFVEMIPGRGAFVAKTSDDETNNAASWFAENEVQINDFMEVREAIETLAVKLAIPRITDQQMREMEAIHQGFEKAAQENNVIQLISYDEAFHKTIVDATGNKLLIGIYEKVAEAFSEYRANSFSVKKNAKNALQPHRNILDAIKRKDADGAVREVSNHIGISIADITNVINSQNE